MIYTCYKGRNQDLIPEVAKLYFAPGMRIADVTFGKGNFWKNIDVGQYDFYPSDIITGTDFRALPYPDTTMDAIVLDPPYVHNGGSFKINATYNNTLVTGNFDTVLQLYRDGIIEARRVLKYNGLLLIKCQDIVEGRVQRWSHILIKDFAESIGFRLIDLFVLHQSTTPMDRMRRWGKQVHARRNHSYLLVFKLRSKEASFIMPVKYHCDHCNREPLYLKKGKCPVCGNKAVKLIFGADLSNKPGITVTQPDPNEDAN